MLNGQDQNIVHEIKTHTLMCGGVFFLFLLILGVTCSWGALDQKWKQTFPKLAGMNIGTMNYDEPRYQYELAKMDLVILGFYRGWHSYQGDDAIRQTVKEIKSLNPNIKVGQYTLLAQAYDNPENIPNADKYNKLYANNWWLKTSDGEKVQWTSEYKTWEVNCTDWTKADSEGMRYSEWVARRDYALYFGPVPEFDIWYFDNVMWRPRVLAADWDLDGKNDSRDEERIQTAYRQGHEREWDAARELAPNLVFIGNADNDLSFPEYKRKLQGAFLEALMGKQWSMEKWAGWEKMMEMYHAEFLNTSTPHVIIFNVWGEENDYRFFRYAFTSSLLNDGYFSFTSNTLRYSSVVWFDEYDINLGHALESPALSPWKDGVYKREFENGLVLVNPTELSKIVDIGSGFKHFLGIQDEITNNGKPVTTLSLPPKDGVVLIRISINAPKNFVQK